jgi:DNA-binding transcriptional ArsR family regulator
MRALAHPVRVALLEALTREGPLTATEAAELLGETPANCSFHLRTLAKYGFVEEAEGGTGRSRPWRRTALGNAFELVHDDAEASVAAQSLADMNNERVFEAVRTWNATRGAYPPAWRSASFLSSMLAYVTPEEMTALGEELLAVIMRYRDRTLDLKERPAGAAPVSLVVIGHPLPRSPSGN